MKKMKTISALIKGRIGKSDQYADVEVTGYEAAPGWIVHRGLNDLPEQTRYGRWCVSHIGTGLTLLTGDVTRADALYRFRQLVKKPEEFRAAIAEAEDEYRRAVNRDEAFYRLRQLAKKPEEFEAAMRGLAAFKAEEENQARVNRGGGVGLEAIARLLKRHKEDE